MDYQGNSDKKKKAQAPKKTIEPVAKGEMFTPKKSLGRKFMETFIAENLKSVSQYVLYEVLIPSFQNMILDSAVGGIEKAFGKASMRGRRNVIVGGGGHTTYQTAVRRTPYPTVDNLDRTGLPSAYPQLGGARVPSDSVTAVLFPTKGKAAEVLERMGDILDQYQVVSVADLNALAQTAFIPHTDELWGWTDLTGARVTSVREGFLLELPDPQSIREG